MSQRKAVREHDWVAVTHFLEALAGTADVKQVLDWYDFLAKRLSNRRAHMVMRQVYAELFMLMGLENKAFELLRDCARDGIIDILWVDRCPLLAPLRSMEGFGEIRDWVWLNAYGVWN